MKRNLPQNKTSFFDNVWFKITTLSPVHIGTGYKLFKGLDFITGKDSTKILDMNYLFKELIGQEDLSEVIMTGSLTNLAKRNSVDFSKVSKLNLEGEAFSSELQEMMTDGDGNPMIPGSSIKGSLRTVLFEKMVRELNNTTIGDQIKWPDGRKKPRDPGSRLESRIMSPHSNQPGNGPNYDIGRIFRPSDAIFQKKDLCVVNAFIANYADNRILWKGVNRKNVRDVEQSTPVSLIALDEYSESNPFRFSIDTKMHSAIRLNNYDMNLEYFVGICNEWADNILAKETEYWRRDVRYTKDYIDFVNEVKNEREQAKKRAGGNAWIQRIGWGSGLLSMTGGYQDDNLLLDIRDSFFQERTVDFFPKTRKVSDICSLPFGWVLVEQIN